MSTLRFTTFSKLFKKVDCVVSALAVLPTIPDLAEAWELRIKYAYALTLPDILCLSQFQLGASPPEFRPPGKFLLSNSLPLGQKIMVERLGVGQNFLKLEETAPYACKKSFKIIKKTTSRVQIFYLENFIF